MTLRARPTTRPGRHGGPESDARRNLYFNLAFGLVIVVAVLLLVGAGAASWYDDHLAPVATVNGETITKDALRDRVAVESFRLTTIDSQTRAKITAGKMSTSQGEQLLNYIAQLESQVSSDAYDREIDTTLILQLAKKEGIEATAAEIDAEVATEGTVAASRHTYVIQVTPETSTGATEPTQAQKDAAKQKADGLLADLTAGMSWEDVVKKSGDADAAAAQGDLYFLDEGTTSPDEAFVKAIFALDAPGYTGVVEGKDGVFRIGRLTEIAAAVPDPSYMDRAAKAGVNEAAYRRAASSIVIRDKFEARILSQVVDNPSEQRRAWEMALEDNSGAEIAPGAVLVRQLLFAPKNDPTNASTLAADDPAWKAAEDEARTAYAALTAGTKRFVDLAASSDDTSSAAQNGFLPYYAKDDPSTSLDPAFAAAIFADGLTPGQLLEPVKTQYGWHVIQFVTTDTPAVRAQKLSAEAATPGADLAKLAADNSIATSATAGGDLGWIAHYQLDKDEEDVIFATPAAAVSTTLEKDGLRFYKVNEIAQRTPEGDQADTLRANAFSTWYQGIKNDPAQTTIERLLGN